MEEKKAYVRIKQFSSGTFFVSIPKNVVEAANLKEGSHIEINIKKINEK
ncbi:MAG: hypothetical protein R6U59_00750 [Eubacteriales bacterium]